MIKYSPYRSEFKFHDLHLLSRSSKFQAIRRTSCGLLKADLNARMQGYAYMALHTGCMDERTGSGRCTRVKESGAKEAYFVILKTQEKKRERTSPALVFSFFSFFLWLPLSYKKECILTPLFLCFFFLSSGLICSVICWPQICYHFVRYFFFW